MTEQDKQLLLQDLCARLPYKVVLDYGYNAFDVRKGNYVKRGSKCILNCYLLDVFMSPRQNEKGEYIKPYLRPLSSMTEEEFVYFMSIRGMNLKSFEIQKMMSENFSHLNSVAIVNTLGRYSHNIDWLNKNMFDYRGLIPKGLAIEAPKDMYK